jgi:RNA polymerase sigma-70 factor (ECF subfamily)
MVIEEKGNSISLEALKAGDRAEFAHLMDLYSGKIYNLLNRMLNNMQDAEDALQETFFKAFRNIKDFEGRSHVSTWLYRIAVNEALMMIRKRQENVLSIDENDPYQDEMNESRDIVDWHWLPEDELLSDETNKILEQSIRELSPPLRAVFLLRDIDGLSIKETADAMDISEENVKVRLFRARFQLRDMLSDYFGEHYSIKKV